MYLNYVHVINFGPFDNFRINLKPNYLNIIQGVNGSGKTQLFGSLLTPLLGEKVIKIDKSNSPQESMVSISITNNDVTQINELNYNNNNFLYKFSSLNTFKTKDPFYHQKFISYYHISIPFFLTQNKQ
ncbi:hypothetical protein BK702_03740 [Bacillus thuringiensis serovar cameroun]|nr:hypothetical protein BK702_03740 [Bacillus thuringiensis serovar cameroun]